MLPAISRRSRPLLAAGLRVSVGDVTEPSVFTRVIRGEFPGHFVWRDEEVVAFMTIAPLRPGHVLVVPVEQIDKWTDVPLPLWTRLNEVAHTIAGALDATFEAVRVGLIVAGLEVPHCHIHLIPIQSEADLSFANADPSVPAEELAAHAATIRRALAARGHSSEI